LAPAIRPEAAASELVRALRFLGQAVPDDLAAAPLAEVWQWAHAHWSFARIPRMPAIPLASPG